MKKELKEYIDSKQNILKRIKVKNPDVTLVKFNSLKWIIGESSNMNNINKEVLQNKLYISNLGELYLLENLNSFDILSIDRIESYITMNISAHICLDTFLNQYQASIVNYCMGIKDYLNSDIDKLKQEKKELASMMLNGCVIPSILLERFNKMQKDIDTEINIYIDKIKDRINILGKFNKMMRDVYASKEAWCGLLDLINKK